MDSQESSDAIHRKVLKSQKEERKTGKKRRMGEYFRFNVKFAGGEPRLDDTKRMHELKSIAYETVCHSRELDRLARCLIAELFFFELDPGLRRENGQYSCTGYIFCRLRAGSTAFDSLLTQLFEVNARFLLKGRTLPGAIQDRSSLGRDGNFRKRVCFDITSRQESISLQLQEGSAKPCDISGSPFSLDWLIEVQGLEVDFGTGDHVKRRRKRADSDEGKSRKRRRF